MLTRTVSSLPVAHSRVRRVYDRQRPQPELESVAKISNTSRAHSSIGGGQSIFFNGNLDDIPVDNPTRERWFNIDAGFARESTTVPAAFQKRGFPFRLDDVRTMPLTFTNLSIQRSFGLGAQRTIQVRVDAQNVFNRQQWVGPNVNPASTQFGQVTNVALNQMRFFTFGLRTTF